MVGRMLNKIGYDYQISTKEREHIRWEKDIRKLMGDFLIDQKVINKIIADVKDKYADKPNPYKYDKAHQQFMKIIMN